MSVDVELVLKADAELGEGPIWNDCEKRLYWVDILQGRLHIFDPVSRENRTIQFDQSIGTVVPCQAGGVMVALHHGFAHVDIETEKVTMLVDPENDIPENRFNDGKCDPAGRLWAGTMSLKDGVKEAGCLYCLDTQGTVEKKREKVSISNGIVWNSKRDTMYFIDTPTMCVDAYDYDNGTGSISNRRPVVYVSETETQGYPDGMAIDAEDNLWVALWGGHGVVCWNPRSGKKLGKIELPVSQVTACAFGGDHLDELYITTAHLLMTEKQRRAEPDAGGLYCAKVNVKGAKTFDYLGPISK